MKMSINCDTYLPHIIELADELKTVCEKVDKNYYDVKFPSVIGVAFRCLPDEIKRKTFCRYDKKDGFLTIDLTVSYEKYQKLYKIERRHELGHVFYNYLEETLKKYDFSELSTNKFLFDFKTWCNEIGWLQDEVDYSLDLDY